MDVLNGVLDMSEWIESSKQHWMTLADVAALPPGEPVYIVMFHRNVGDLCKNDDVNPCDCAIRPDVFFRTCVVTFVPDSDGGGTKGVVNFIGDEDIEPYHMELDVEYKTDSWYPLENGFLPASDPQGYAKLLGYSVHWSKMEKSTYVGWRGPMMLLDAVKDASNSYIMWPGLRPHATHGTRVSKNFNDPFTIKIIKRNICKRKISIY
jgi:hypothetical protein